MLRQFKSIVICSGFLFLLISIPSKAQILQDTATLNLVKEDVDHIYDLQFPEARETYARIISNYPNHPIVFLLKGMIIYWENFPMLHVSPFHVSFEENMHECIRISEKNNNPAYEAEYLLANLCARGMLLMFYEDNGLTMEVTPLTISTYKYLRRAFDFASASADLSYFTGLYNYFREAYPRRYPVYKSLAFLFPHGSTEEGLVQLKTAARNSIVLRAESAILLIWIYLGFEDDIEKSSVYGRFLYEKYPDNGFLCGMYIKTLLLLKKYDESEKLISSLPAEGENKYVQAQLLILKGIIQEKKYQDNELAQKYYNEGISDISLFGNYGNEFAAYAYFGLSRISESNDEMNSSKTYRKEASKLAEFKKISFDK